MNLVAFLLTTVSGFCWSVSHIMGKMALRKMDLILFSVIRFSLALPFFLFMLTPGWANVFEDSGLMALVFLTGFVNAIGLILYFHLLNKGAAHRVVPISFSYPIFTFLFAMVFLGEKVKSIFPLSAVLTILGIRFLSPAQKGVDLGKWELPLACLVALIWGPIPILQKYLLIQGINEGSLIFMIYFSGVIFLAPALIFHSIKSDREKMHIGINKTIGYCAFSSLVGLVIAQLLYFYALNIDQASSVSLVNLTVIPFGFLLSIPILGERSTWRNFAGMIMVFIGVSMIAI